MIDIQEKKKKIISFLENNGPSLPVRIAKTIGMDPVFASAIVSELLGTKEVKTSSMKIGSSPLYLIPGQEKRLEEHTENLKSVEKDAYLKLKEKKIIKDEQEVPAIRVALRNIKDFAIPFKFQEKIMWKYAFTPNEEIQRLLSPTKRTERGTEEVPKAWKVKKEEIKQAKEESKKIENIFREKQTTKSTTKTFLEQIEEFLGSNGRKIISIEEVDKKKVIAKTETDSEIALLFAFKKKRVDEEELMKCYKKAKTENLPYHIIVLGDLTKKMNDTIDAYKKLLKVEKLDST
jgi:hypothetical protein